MIVLKACLFLVGYFFINSALSFSQPPAFFSVMEEIPIMQGMEEIKEFALAISSHVILRWPLCIVQKI